MAPHIEVKCQAVVGGGGIEHTFGTHWEAVPDTNHRTGDFDSKNARRAHELLTGDRDKYREVKDHKGKPCGSASGAVVFDGLLFEPKEKG